MLSTRRFRSLGRPKSWFAPMLLALPLAGVADDEVDQRHPHDVVVFAPACDQASLERLLASGPGAVAMRARGGNPAPSEDQFTHKLRLRYAYALEQPDPPLAHYCPAVTLQVDGSARGDPGAQDNTATDWCQARYNQLVAEDKGKETPKATRLCPHNSRPVEDQATGAKRPMIRGSHDQVNETPAYLCFVLCADEEVANLSGNQAILDDLTRKLYDHPQRAKELRSSTSSATSKE